MGSTALPRLDSLLITLLKVPSANLVEIARSLGVTAPKPLNRLTYNLTWAMFAPYATMQKVITQLQAFGRMKKYHYHVVCIFLFCDPKFCSRPETKPQNKFYVV